MPTYDFERGVEAGIDALIAYFRNEDDNPMVAEWGIPEGADAPDATWESFRTPPPLNFRFLTNGDLEAHMKGALQDAMRDESERESAKFRVQVHP